MGLITKNKAAFFNYQISDRFEAGIILSGPEVKSVKGGQVNLKGSYVMTRGNELWLINCHIAPYKTATLASYQPRRDRKLLLKRKEIASLIGTLRSKGLTVLPLSVYTRGSLIKLEIGVGRGRKEYDKRDIIKKRESDRTIRRSLRGKN